MLFAWPSELLLAQSEFGQFNQAKLRGQRGSKISNERFLGDDQATVSLLDDVGR